MKQGAVYGQKVTILSIPQFTVMWAEEMAQIKGEERSMTTKCCKALEIESWSKKTKSYKREHWDNW